MPTTPTDADGHGLLVVHEPEGQVNLDIVAVHGLNGKRWSTWTDGEAMWLRDFLPGKIKDARIMTFGYDANVINNLSTLDVRGHANKLLSRLRNRRDDPPVEERPIVFICHSLGGIVVKQALRLAHNDPAYSDIANSTKGIVFLGTPHRGSGMADWAGLLANVVRVSVFIKVKKDLLKVLANDSEELLRISEDFRTIVNNYKITSFYEEDKLKGVDRAVVPRHSAIMEIPGEDAMPLDGNHMEICRFRSADSEQFELVWKAVRRVSGLTATPAADSSAIVNSLSELQFSALPDKSILPLPGTFSWFGGHSEVVSWLNNPATPFMHITGKHGSGKTFLSAHMYHNLTQAGLKCIYLPCTSLVGDKDTRGIARNLIGGLLHAEPAYADVMFPRGPTYDRQLHSLSGPETLAELGRLLDLLRSKRLVIILDGADDVGEDLPTLIDALQGIWLSSTLRLAFLTRPRTDLLTDQDKCVHLDLDHVLESSQDIDLYIAAMVEAIIKRRPGMASHKGEITASLKKRADGMFLLVTLLSQKVLTLKLSSARRIREQLASLPESLADAYEDRLAMVEESDRGWVRSTLLWLRFGWRRLIGPELAIAVASLPQNEESTMTMHEDEDWVDDIACDFLIDLTHSLGSLVTMSSDRSIGFAHGTVGEFLSAADSTAWYAVSQEEATASLASSSLRILRHSSRHHESPEDGQALTPRKQHFLIMTVFAAEGLPDLARDLRRDSPVMADVCEFMNNEELFSKWQRVYWHLFDPDRRPMPSPFHIAGILNLHELMHALLQRLGQPEQDRLLKNAGHEAQSILDCCAEGGASELIKSLIKLGANPNSHYKENRTVLSTAAWYGQIEAIKVLVSHGANLDAVDCRGRSALDAAAESGRNTAIIALLDLGASVNNSIWPSPLVAAIEHNRVATMELLIDRGADINHIASDGYTPARNASPLHAAAYYGRPSVVKRLLELGADVNLKSHGDSATPVHVAAQVGDRVSLEHLLATGADPLAKTRRGETALDWLITGTLAIQRSDDPLLQSSRKSVFDQLFSLTQAALSEDDKDEAYLAIMRLVFENQERTILEHVIASHPQLLSDKGRLYKEVVIKFGKGPLLELMTEGLISLKAEARSLQLAVEEASNSEALAWLCECFGEGLVQATDSEGRTGLHRVIRGASNNKPGLARAYIAGGADPMQRDHSGESPFSVALAPNINDYVRGQLLSIFVSAGARLSPSGLQDLLEPCKGNDTVYTKALIDVSDAETFDMETYKEYPHALHSFFIVALESKCETWLEKVRSACDDESYQQHIWQELVRQAAKAVTWRVEASLDRLLSQPGLNVSYTDEGGDTVLHLFARTGGPQVLDRLIALGADKNAINKAGRTPGQEALRKGRPDIAKRLA